MFFRIIIAWLISVSLVVPGELKVVDRGNNWQLNSLNPTISDMPTNLKFFQYYDVLPDELNIKIFENKDLSAIKDKKLFVGYGIADAKGKNCVILKPSETGLKDDVKICLPWWRIEREYKNSAEKGQNTSFNIFENISKPKPPIMVNVCQNSQGANYYNGGKISCTSYYDKMAGEDCWENPMQEKCYVDNCSKSITNNCSYVDTIIGEDTTLETAVIDESKNPKPVQEETKINLASHIYDCPSGSITQECTSTKSVLMFPYECKLDNPDTPIDDGEYTYCDEKKPVYDATGKITGFKGMCASGESMTCKVDSFQDTSAECIEPIYETFEKYKTYEFESKKSYQEVSVDVLSGEPDMYSADENCLRSNTIEDSRDKELYVKIVGNGYLDDDIYVLRHGEGGDFTKVYCNMQHAGPSPSMGTNLKSCMNTKTFSKTVTDSIVNDALSCVVDPGNFSSDFIKTCMTSLGYTFGSKSTDLKISDAQIIYDCGELIKTGSATKYYEGVPLSCLRNNGSYSFNDTVKINSTDLVTVQQNSEQEMNNPTPFSMGRNHYSSTKVVIDGIEVAPDTSTSYFPYYPANSPHLRTWDNTTATFSLLFPFAGAYELYFYNKNGSEIAIASINVDDFKEIAEKESKNLKLGSTMALADGISEDLAGRGDAWVEWGGGVFGGKGSKDGKSVNSPNDNYVKENSATNIIVKDLNTGAITPIALVYPLPYPNRVFISKLKVYEHRKYRCYSDFTSFSPPGNTSNKYVCSTDSNWIDFNNGTNSDKDSFFKWDDNAMCEQNCFTQNTCTATKIDGKDAFTCEAKGGADIGGDLGGNYFSSEYDCNSNCKVSNPCSTYNESNCEVVNESLDNQAQDFTGKALYTKRNTTYRCQHNETKQVGCAKYNYTVTEGNLDINFEALGYETKDFRNSFENSVTSANMLDVGSQHIWSGWKGKCVVGMKMDSSYLSDPMTIASYAMSAYSAFGGGDGSMLESLKDSKTYGDTISAAAESIDKGIEAAKSTYNSAMSSVGEMFSNGASSATSGASDGWFSSAEEAYKAAESGVKGFWNTAIVEKGTLWKEITAGDLVKFGVSVVMDILAPTEDEFKLAQKLLNPLQNNAEVSVQAYNSCLTSIGLSFPAMVGYSYGEKDSMSNELIAPWEHPLRLTTQELQTLVNTMGQKYVEAAYLYSSDDNININVIASNQEAYIKAGQTICAGHKVSEAMSYISIKTGSKLPSRAGSSGEAIATSAGMAAISMMNPALGFALKVAMDLYTNMFTKINTCEDESDAIAKDMLEYKTNKFNNNGLCRQIDSYCDKYFNFGFKKKCVRDGYDFCCYDKATTKIFAESLKEQLNQGWENCQGITINDLKDISFRECRAGEIPSINKCISTEKFDEYKKTLFKQATRGVSVEGLAEQVMNAVKQE